MCRSSLLAVVATAACLVLVTSCGSDGASSDVESTAGDGDVASQTNDTSNDVETVSLPPFEAGNNYALIDGDPIGEGTVANTELIKEVSISVTSPAAGLTLGTARIARRSLTADGFRVGVVLTNEGPDPRCQIALRGVSFRDATGGEVAHEDLMFISGSVGAVSSTFFANTCLGSGETSWLVDITTNGAFDQVDHITADELDGGNAPVGGATTRVIPQSYKATPGDTFFTGLEVVLSNEGEVGCAIGSYNHVAILLDENGDFLWFAMPAPLSPTTLAPGATTPLVDNAISYKGAASRLAFRVAFDAPL